MRRWPVALGGVFAVGCAVALFPVAHPAEAVRPVRAAWEPWHHRAWDEVAACVRRPRPFPAGVTLWLTDGDPSWSGLWWAARQRIYVQRGVRDDTALLKHEFVHVLEDRPGHGPLFAEWKRCGFVPHPGPLGR